MNYCESAASPDLAHLVLSYWEFAVARGANGPAARVSENTLVWGFENPRAGTIRFTIKLNEKGQWFEIGEISRDGKAWQKFFKMTLSRTS